MDNLIAFCTIEASKLKSWMGYLPDRCVGSHALSFDIPNRSEWNMLAAHRAANPPEAVPHSNDELRDENQDQQN